ncbi:hypothetical protein [Rhodococcus opacus]|uniref:hypothetical protein n=1 Tax=Rhodococcus opacus TaxID=37919 RepID=UPI002952DFB3|nr:hypothetical protein [Rhodococcus opacus]MDV7086871.1 hypothetical protein [Rhodococcus opacus]
MEGVRHRGRGFFTGMLLRRSDAHIRLPVAQILTRTGRQLLPALLVVVAAALVTMITRPFTLWGAAAD